MGVRLDADIEIKPSVVSPSAVQLVGDAVKPIHIPRADIVAGIPKDVTSAPMIADVAVIEEVVGEERMAKDELTVYVAVTVVLLVIVIIQDVPLQEEADPVPESSAVYPETVIASIVTAVL